MVKEDGIYQLADYEVMSRSFQLQRLIENSGLLSKNIIYFFRGSRNGLEVDKNSRCPLRTFPRYMLSTMIFK